MCKVTVLNTVVSNLGLILNGTYIDNVNTSTLDYPEAQDFSKLMKQIKYFELLTAV